MNDFFNKKTAVALGSFDGLHKGHIAVINQCIDKKNKDLTPLVLLFNSHPLKIINGKSPKSILTDSIKFKLISDLGCKYTILNFEEIRNFSCEEFVQKILKEKLNTGFVSCGFNYRFGKNGTGNTQILKNLCDKYGIELSVTPQIDFEGEPISSTRIRKAIEDGEIEYANKMLYCPFTFDFQVIHGDAIGRTLGFPTANQHFDSGFVIPKFGVYASKTNYKGKIFPSVSNIGIRPTLNGTDIRCETNIIGLNEDLYSEKPEITLISYLREEKKFSNLEELKKQITEDSLNAVKIFGEGDSL